MRVIVIRYRANLDHIRIGSMLYVDIVRMAQFIIVHVYTIIVRMPSVLAYVRPIVP